VIAVLVIVVLAGAALLVYDRTNCHETMADFGRQGATVHCV
jgi:hypothetical protein